MNAQTSSDEARKALRDALNADIDRDVSATRAVGGQLTDGASLAHWLLLLDGGAIQQALSAEIARELLDPDLSDEMITERVRDALQIVPQAVRRLERSSHSDARPHWRVWCDRMAGLLCAIDEAVERESDALGRVANLINWLEARGWKHASTGGAHNLRALMISGSGGVSVRLFDDGHVLVSVGDTMFSLCADSFDQLAEAFS